MLLRNTLDEERASGVEGAQPTPGPIVYVPPSVAFEYVHRDAVHIIVRDNAGLSALVTAHNLLGVLINEKKAATK